MFSKRIIFGLLLILLIGSLSASLAENVTYTGYGNGVYKYNNTQNETIYGYCLNSSLSSPSNGTIYNVSTNTSNIDNRIKELIVNNYRGDSIELHTNNVALRTAIWNITNHQSLSSNSLALEMMDNLTGTEIGNTYTVSDGEYNYIFNFFYGKAGNSILQPMILFNFLKELLPVVPEVPENTTNDTNKTPGVPEVPENTNNDINTTPSDDLDNKTKTPNNTNSNNNNNTNNNTNVTVVPHDDSIIPGNIITNANMKQTGIPVIVTILVLLVSIVVIVRKK